MPAPIAETLMLDVEKPAAGGRMLARHDGLVILVDGAIPGERVVARVDRVARGVTYATTMEVLSPSGDRRDVPFDPRCGGCLYAHVNYPRQLQLKGEIIADAFARIGRFRLDHVPPVLASPEGGYRMRARLHVRSGRLGFFREATHDLCDATATGQLLESTARWVRWAQDVIEHRHLNGIAALEIAENIPAHDRVCHLELHAGVEPEPFVALADGLSGLCARRADRHDAVVLAGSPVVSDVLHARPGEEGSPFRLRRDVRAFFQGNRYLTEPLAQHVVSHVTAGPVLDLYAGVGLFGLAAAASGNDDVIMVEGDPIGAMGLRGNAESFGPGIRVRRESVEAFFEQRVPHCETVIVDPPRTGVSRAAMTGILGVRPARVVYVSCDVATLARDGRTMMDSGYELQDVTGFDLFPNTAHVETVAVFGR